jgi:ribonuclease BN (tRNA processing enzyme)
MGFPFFKPLHTANAHIHLHGCPFDAQYVKKILSQVMGEPHFPVAYADLRARISYEPSCPQTFEIGSVTVEPIPTSHPNGGNGYRFTENGKSVVFLTDNELGFRHPGGLPFSEYVARIDGADLLIHDAEYTPQEYRRFRKWGHSVYTDAVRLASEAGCQRLGLFHLNPERTDTEMDRIVSECKDIISTAGNGLECFGVGGHWQVTL